MLNAGKIWRWMVAHCSARSPDICQAGVTYMGWCDCDTYMGRVSPKDHHSNPNSSDVTEIILLGSLEVGDFFCQHCNACQDRPVVTFSENPSVLMGRGVPNLVVSGFFKIVLFRVPYKHLAFAKVDPTACPIVHGWMDEWMDTSGRCKATNLWPSGRLSAGRCCVCIWYRVVSCAALWRRFYFSQQQFAHLQITHLHICQLSAEEFWQVVCTAVMVVALCWELHHQPQKRFESHNHHHLTHIHNHHNHHHHHHPPFKFSLSCTKRVKITRTISSWDNENLITRPMLHSNQLDFGRDAAGRGAIASKSGILSLNKFQQQRQFVNLGSISRVDIWSIFGQQQQRPVHQYLSPSVDRSHSYLWSRFAVMCRLRLSAAARSTERAWDATNKNHNLHMRSDQLQFKARSKRCCRMSSVATLCWPVNQCVGDNLALIETRWILRCHLSCTGFTCSCQLCRNVGIIKSKVTVQSPYWALDRFALNNEHRVETSCY